MRLWIAVHLPQLSLDVFCPNWSSEARVVVIERERIVALAPALRATGLRLGMRQASITLLAPEAQVRVRDPAREAQLLHECALALLQFTPQLALAEQATLLLDIGASLRLFGGIMALCRKVSQVVARMGCVASLACAPTGRGAWLLAQGMQADHAGTGGKDGKGDNTGNAGKRGRRMRAGARCVKPASLERRLARLPVALLPPLAAYLPWLTDLGCHTVQQLRNLPRAGLQRRCGKAVLDMLDCAHGLAPEMHDWIEAPLEFKARFEFYERILHTDATHHAAERLITQMVGWLCARHLAVAGISLWLEHERGRSAIEPTRIDITLGEPDWRSTHLLLLLKERLQKCDLPAPVLALVLEATRVQAMTPQATSLFPEPGGNPADYRRLLELLSARLGPEQVCEARPVADYRPEVANGWPPLTMPGTAAGGAGGKVAGNAGSVAGAGTGALAGRLPPSLLPRPCWLLPQPVPLLVRDNRPFYGSPLKLLTNPERIESGWWQGDLVLRDYFVAEGQDHTLYWVYRERLQTEACWFLHGLFG